jgi:hypothetical protein
MQFVSGSDWAFFLIIKPTRCTNFWNFILEMKLHASASSSAHHQELFTVHSAMVHVIHVCRQLSSRIRMEHPDPAKKKQTYKHTKCKPVWHIPSLSVQWITPDDGWRNSPKHVEFSFQNKIKFEKLENLVGFIIRQFVMMHDHMNIKYWFSMFYLCVLLQNF